MLNLSVLAPHKNSHFVSILVAKFLTNILLGEKYLTVNPEMYDSRVTFFVPENITEMNFRKLKLIFNVTVTSLECLEMYGSIRLKIIKSFSCSAIIVVVMVLQKFLLATVKLKKFFWYTYVRCSCSDWIKTVLLFHYNCDHIPITYYHYLLQFVRGFLPWLSYGKMNLQKSRSFAILPS